MIRSFNKSMLFLLGALVAGAVTLSTMASALAEPKLISVDQAFAAINQNPDMLVLDVRTPGEFNGELGHLDRAVNIDFREIPAALTANVALFDVPKSAPIFVHCHTDVRASIAAKTLRDAGFDNITVIDDGMVAWHNAGLPVSHTR